MINRSMRHFPSRPAPCRLRGGFSVVELLVVISVVVILLSIFIPYFMSIHERANRVKCTNNLRTIFSALGEYGKDNQQDGRTILPRVVYQPDKKAVGYTAFTGADAANPFADESTVSPNDVSASLWLLVRGNYITDPSVFVCPSTWDRPDPLTSAAGEKVGPDRRGNFRSARHLSYSYASPFSNAEKYELSTDVLEGDFVIMADRNPGRRADGKSDVTAVDSTAAPLAHALANSLNHDRAGQNVLYAYGNIVFVNTPYVGVNRDNIYTAQAQTPVAPGATSRPSDTPGYIGTGLSPIWGDSFLVPTAQDGE